MVGPQNEVALYQEGGPKLGSIASKLGGPSPYIYFISVFLPATIQLLTLAVLSSMCWGLQGTQCTGDFPTLLTFFHPSCCYQDSNLQWPNLNE